MKSAVHGRHRAGVVVSILVALLGLGTGGHSARAATGPTATCFRSGSGAATVVATLQQMNYSVQCGSISFNIDAQGQCTTKTAVNPSTCYGEYSLPGRTGEASSTLYQIDDDEAILTLGALPPPTFYYGYYTYIYNRMDPTVTPPAYFNIQAPVGAAMNQRNAAPGLHVAKGGSAYQMFGNGEVVITTANKTTLNDIITVLSSVYGAGKIQNLAYVEQLPVDIMHLGSSGSADQLKTALRLTPFTPQPGQIDPVAVQYMQRPPMAVLRVSPLVPRTGDASVTYTTATDPLPPTKVLPGQVWEEVLLGNAGVTDVNQALNTIMNNVIADRLSKNEVVTATTQVTNGAELVGRDCLATFETAVTAGLAASKPVTITKNMQCLDGSPDAAYYGIQNNSVKFPVGGEVVLIGVNHGTLGSSTYSSVAVQSPSSRIAALTNLELNGSATPFLDQTIPTSAADDFYVVSFNTQCGSGSTNCMYMIPGRSFAVDERAYLTPQTATSPDYTDIVPSIWLSFGPASGEHDARFATRP